MVRARAIKKITINAVGLVVIASAVYGFIGISRASEVEHHESHTAKEDPGLHLSHDLKVILNQEMSKIEEGMMGMIPAISAGDWETIASIAQQIKDSFILKQKLTQGQIEELHHSLSAEFLEMDRDFHSSAGKLAHAAHKQDGELVSFYFYNLHSQCIKCHSKYASERFPNFQKIEHGKGDH